MRASAERSCTIVSIFTFGYDFNQLCCLSACSEIRVWLSYPLMSLPLKAVLYQTRAHFGGSNTVLALFAVLLALGVATRVGFETAQGLFVIQGRP